MVVLVKVVELDVAVLSLFFKMDVARVGDGDCSVSAGGE